MARSTDADLDLILGYLRRQWLPEDVREAYHRLLAAQASRAARLAALTCPFCGDLKDDPAYPTCRKTACLDRLWRAAAAEPEAPQA